MHPRGRRTTARWRVWPALAAGCVVALGLLAAAGCRRPDRANIELRKQIQDLEAQIADLQRQRQGDQATIRSLQSQRQTVATLPQERLQQLFTAHGLKLGRLTGGADLDPSRPGDEGLQVHVVPTDQRGDLLKAAGSFVIDAFDLSEPQDSHLGRWTFSAEEAAANWFGSVVTYGYTLHCPWQRPPRSDQLTVRVTFEDALTGRQFTEQKVVSVVPPRAAPATGAAGVPSAAPAPATRPDAME